MAGRDRFDGDERHHAASSSWLHPCSGGRGRGRALIASLALVLVVLGGAARAESEASVWLADLGTRPGLLPDPGGHRASLEEQGVVFEVAYTIDFLANVRGGLARKNDYVGNLDATIAWATEPLLGRDLGTFFVYGLWNHGGRPSDFVGDTQGVDNVEAPDSAKLLEAWWQKALLDGDASILLGLYDVNSEFYAIDSAELFVHSSFGMGAALGTSGVNGPSTFPATSLGARFKIEPIRGFEFQAAVVDGIPGDPRRPKGTRIDIEADDGALVIAEIGYHRSAGPDVDVHEDALRATQRRRVGRIWTERPHFVRVSLGSWIYTARQPHVSRTNVLGDPIRSRGHPGLYLAADFDADALDLFATDGLSLFLQLGWADGDVGQFEGYAGGGFTYVGLLPFRPEDDTGFAVAAAFNGDGFRDGAKDVGAEPGVAEIALEWTHRAALTPWLSMQGDVQYVVNPGGLRDRPDAVVVGLRWVIDL